MTEERAGERAMDGWFWLLCLFMFIVVWLPGMFGSKESYECHHIAKRMEEENKRNDVS